MPSLCGMNRSTLAICFLEGDVDNALLPEMDERDDSPRDAEPAKLVRLDERCTGPDRMASRDGPGIDMGETDVEVPPGVLAARSVMRFPSRLAGEDLPRDWLRSLRPNSVLYIVS